MLHLVLRLLLEPTEPGPEHGDDDRTRTAAHARAPPRTTAWVEAVGDRERRLHALGPGLVNEPFARTFLRLKDATLAHARAKGAPRGSAAAERAVEHVLREKARRARARALRVRAVKRCVGVLCDARAHRAPASARPRPHSPRAASRVAPRAHRRVLRDAQVIRLLSDDSVATLLCDEAIGELTADGRLI